MENKLEKLIVVGSGLVIGVIDVLTSGLPLVSTYSLANTISKLEYYDKEFFNSNKKDILVNFGYSLIGNTIPFYIKYSEEVNNFISQI